MDLRGGSYTVENLKLRFHENHPDLDFESWWNRIEIEAQVIEEKELQPGCENFDFCFLGQSHYPCLLSQTSDPPLALAYEGDLFKLNSWITLGAVGSREPHLLTQEWLKDEFYQFLKNNSMMTISGGARGVDQMVHHISLFAGRPTCVVLPSGLADKYPSIWKKSRDWVDQGVLFISEMRHGSKIAKHHFSARNRIIAGLSSQLLIAEARQKSGTMMTAHHALIENRSVLVVPGHPRLNEFKGSLELLNHGATIVNQTLDIAESMGISHLRNN